MKTFDVYHHPHLGYRAVKRGISWPGLLFGIFWALSRKLWDVAFMFTLSILVIGWVEDDYGIAIDWAYWVPTVLTGVFGNPLRRPEAEAAGLPAASVGRSGHAVCGNSAVGGD